MEAVQILGQRVGIEVEKPLYSEQKPASPHQALYDMHEDAAKFYHAILMTTTMGEEARNYLYQRGLTDEVLKHFWIGLAPPERNYLINVCLISIVKRIYWIQACFISRMPINL